MARTVPAPDARRGGRRAVAARDMRDRRGTRRPPSLRRCSRPSRSSPAVASTWASAGGGGGGGGRGSAVDRRSRARHGGGSATSPRVREVAYPGGRRAARVRGPPTRWVWVSPATGTSWTSRGGRVRRAAARSSSSPIRRSLAWLTGQVRDGAVAGGTRSRVGPASGRGPRGRGRPGRRARRGPVVPRARGRTTSSTCCGVPARLAPACAGRLRGPVPSRVQLHPAAHRRLLVRGRRDRENRLLHHQQAGRAS